MADGSYRIGRGYARMPRAAALGLVALAYLVAAGVGGAVVAVLREQHELSSYFWADLAGTLVIFGLSLVVANASLYDPYWSVAPPLIILGWMLGQQRFEARQILLLGLVTLWSVRLTGNWAVGWRGFAQEDWRYIQIREQSAGKVPWWLANFVGIQLVPTLVVYLGLLPAWPAVIGGRPLGWLDGLAVLVMLVAIWLEHAADQQMRRFARDPASKGRTVDIGLWRHSRHPNYLGEISLWWGVWLFGLAAAPDWWWTVVGPLGMVGLFLGVSIPLMETRSVQRRPSYADYKRQVPVLLPLPGRHLR